MEQTNKEAQTESTRDRLLRHAIHMIREEGYNAVSVNQICKKAKVAKGTFYVYFKSKRDILLEILGLVNIELFSNKLWNEDLDPANKLLDYCDTYLQFVTYQGHEMSREIIKVILEASPEPDRVFSFLHADRIRNILLEGQETGIFQKNIDPERIISNLQHLLFGAIVQWCGASGSYKLNETVLLEIQILLSGILLVK